MSQLKVNSIVPVGGLPSGANGGIIQVVQSVKTDTFSSVGAGSSFVDVTGLTVTITPSSNSNKVMIIPSVNMAANSGHRHGFKIVRVVGSSTFDIFIGDANGSNSRVTVFQGNVPTNANSYHYSPLCLDTPGTTNAVTYKLQIKGESNSTDIFINRPQSDNTGSDFFRGVCTMTAMEVTV